MNKSYERAFKMSTAKVYAALVAKAEKKGRTREEVDTVTSWLTGYTPAEIQAQIDAEVDYATFFSEAPKMNPNAALIKGVICGVRVDEIEDPTMQKIRWLDKLVDELARGKAMEKILRA